MILVRRKRKLLWLRMKELFVDTVGWGLEKLRAPAVLKEFEFVDPETNETIYLSTGRRYSVLHVRGKRFFFDRITGVFDGTSTLLQESVVATSAKKWVIPATGGFFSQY
jgi:hypothetical protein